MKNKSKFYNDPEGFPEERIQETNGPAVVKKTKEMIYPRGKMGKLETNTNDRYQGNGRG